MTPDTAHRSGWETSEVVFGIPFLLSLAVEFWVVPLALPEGLLQDALRPVGAALFFVGVWVVVLARREFARYRQSMEPGRPITALVTTRIFSISRNPGYLGVVITLAGVALVFNLMWSLVFLAASIVLCHYVLIAPEERYLKAKFGDEYAAYASTVQRWLGRG